MVESDHSEAGQDVTSTNAVRKIDAIDTAGEISIKRPREDCLQDGKVDLPNKKSRSEMDEQASTLKDESADVPESNGTTMLVDEDKNSQGNGDANLKPTADDAENRESADNASSADMETQEECQEEKSEDEKQEMDTNQDAPDSLAKEDKAKSMKQDEAEDEVIHDTVHYTSLRFFFELDSSASDRVATRPGKVNKYWKNDWNFFSNHVW